MTAPMVLSPKQREALAYFASEPRANPFAAGTISSLRKAGLVAIVPAIVPRCYRVTDEGRAALATEGSA